MLKKNIALTLCVIFSVVFVNCGSDSSTSETTKSESSNSESSNSESKLSTEELNTIAKCAYTIANGWIADEVTVGRFLGKTVDVKFYTDKADSGDYPELQKAIIDGLNKNEYTGEYTVFLKIDSSKLKYVEVWQGSSVSPAVFGHYEWNPKL